MSSSLAFTVERNKPELIAPAKPTPYEFKSLSGIDDQKDLRIQVPFIHFYQNSVAMEGRDPVKIIKEAIAKTLIFYYPFAGRLREGPNEKLIVECTGEGVMFIEAKADVSLAHFGDVPQPPFPGEEKLLYDGPGSGVMLDSPLLLFQVTRFLCGGFILSVRMNHTMCDAIGLLQFMTALGEMARGSHIPSIQSVWNRELLDEHDQPPMSPPAQNDTGEMHVDDMIHRSFFFSTQDILVIKNHLPPHHRKSSNFDILAACFWRCRVVAFGLSPDVKVCLGYAVNTRQKFKPPLPVGFYGNACVLALAQSTAGELGQNTLEATIELVKSAKDNVLKNLKKPWTDPSEKKGWPFFITAETYYMSDVTHISLGLMAIDLGWGRAVYAGPTGTGSLSSLVLPGRSKKGENGIVVTIKLPRPTIDKFAMEIEKTISRRVAKLSHTSSNL